MTRIDIDRRIVWLIRSAVLLPVAWFAHVSLSHFGDPLGQRFDVGLWVIASIAKIANFVSILWLLGLVHRELHRNRFLAVRALAIWAMIPGAVVIALALTRPWWAARLGNDAVKFYIAGAVPQLGPRLLEHREQCLRAWTNGSVVFCELALFVVLAAIQAGAAFRYGHKPRLSVLVGCVASEVMLGSYLAWCPWFLSDYDFFHGDIISGPLLLDQVAVVANDPYTTLTTPLYLAFLGSHLVMLRIARNYRAPQA